MTNPIRQLYSVPVGLASGILLALLFPAGHVYLGWLGQVFLSLLKLLILPLILVSIYASLSGGRDLRYIGAHALVYYVITSATAAALGLVFGLTFSLNLAAGLLDIEQVRPDAQGFSVEVLIQNLIPSNVFASLAEGNILHVVFIAVIASLASRRIAIEHRERLLSVARASDALIMQLLKGILALAPLGIMGLVYQSLARMDWTGIAALYPFLWAVGLAAALHTLAFLPLLYHLRTGTSPWSFLVACRAPLVTALSTASSAATFPVSKQTLEDAGVSERVTSLTLPLGATLNMDGSALYQAILLIFMSQLAGIEPSPVQALYIVLLTMASSAGTAGIPGGGIAMMAFMLDALGLPQTYLALYLIVDRLFDYPITAVNVWGDLVIAASVDRDLRVGRQSSG